MRGVLVDDDQAVAGLRHDIGLVHLRARRAERAVDQLGRRLEALDARIGGRRADLEGGLRGFGEAERGAAARRRRSRAAAPASAASRRRRGAPSPAGGTPRWWRCRRWWRRALALARQRLLQRAHDQPAHQAGVAEAHLGLGRMHVDVDLARIERDEQRQQRMAVARQIIGIGAAHRADQQLVAHRPAVDEQILPERVGARQRRQPGEAVNAHALALGIDLRCALARKSGPSMSPSRASSSSGRAPK